MNVSPLDLRQQRFKRTFRGFDPIEVAAFLDRMDRHTGDSDYRLDALRATLPILLEERSDRARAILEALSDHSTDVAESAPFQGAYGAPLPHPADR